MAVGVVAVVVVAFSEDVVVRDSPFSVCYEKKSRVVAFRD